MSVAKTLKRCLSSLWFRSSMLLVLTLLNGCSTNPAQTSPDSAKEADRPSSIDTGKAQPLCVYETTKGIAEVTEITANSIRFKFYPGDKYFKIPLNEISFTDIKLEQEVKAITRSPISGACGGDEFELLTTIE